MSSSAARERDDGSDVDAEEAQANELVRRMQELDAGQVKLIDAVEARVRLMARLRSVRAK